MELEFLLLEQFRYGGLVEIPFLYILTPAGKTVGAASSSKLRWSSKVALYCVGWLFMGENAITGSSTSGFLSFSSPYHSGILLDVLAGVQNDSRCLACGTGGCQALQCMELGVAFDSHSGISSGGYRTDVILVVHLVSLHMVFCSCVHADCNGNCSFTHMNTYQLLISRRSDVLGARSRQTLQ